jgi:hypothetical protein
MTNYFYYQTPVDYDLITGTSTLVVTLDEVKAQLRISGNTEDSYLTNLILSATNYFELKSGRDLINKTYATYPDNFPGNSGGYAPVLYGSYYGLGSPILLKKSRLQSVTSIEYYKDDALVTFSSSNYYFTKEANNWPQIFLKQDSNWPTDLDNRAQAVKITFVCGFGTTAADVPMSIKQCLLQMITYLYENRGDCGGDCAKLPAFIQSSILTWKIFDL